MKKLFFILFLLLVAFSDVIQAEKQSEITGIKQTVMLYMNSWYKGDADGMKESLHKKLAKRSLRLLSPNKKDLTYTSATDMVFYTKGGYGKNLWQKNLKIEVKVLDHYQDIASVKVLTSHIMSIFI